MRLIIVEDNKLLLENLKILLGGEPGINIEAAFMTTEEALPAVRKIVPDVLLVDLGLPGRSGIELIKEIKDEFPDIDIMAYTVFDNRDTVFKAIKAGASGYILKDATPRELIEALHNLYNGGAPMSPKIARALINEFQNKDVKEEYLLSPREKEILKGLEQGFTYNELADKLHISYHTVHSHIKNIYDKLHAEGRESALLKARKKGLL